MNKLSQLYVKASEPKGYRWFMGLILRMVVVYLFGTFGAHAEEQPLRLVIVTSAHSRIDGLNYPVLRKIYLGSVSSVSAYPIYPLINQSNRLLHEMFLQKVLFMSQNTYKHHLHHTKFPTDTVLPIAYRSEDKLIAHLNAHPGSITYLTERAAAIRPSVRVVMRL